MMIKFKNFLSDLLDFLFDHEFLFIGLILFFVIILIAIMFALAIKYDISGGSGGNYIFIPIPMFR